eukprot:Clim_evm29s197 gene=Clim_evmTU29s197
MADGADRAEIATFSDEDDDVQPTQPTQPVKAEEEPVIKTEDIPSGSKRPAEDDEDDGPGTAAATLAAKRRAVLDSDEDDEDEPVIRRHRVAAAPSAEGGEGEGAEQGQLPDMDDDFADEDDIDDEDLELIAENTGRSIEELRAERKGQSRIRRGAVEERDVRPESTKERDDIAFSDGDDYEGKDEDRKGHVDDEEDEEGEEYDDHDRRDPRRGHPRDRPRRQQEYEEEDDGWLVDNEGRAIHQGPMDYGDEALAEAREIFGDDMEWRDILGSDVESEEGEEPEDDLDDDLDEEDEDDMADFIEGDDDEQTEEARRARQEARAAREERRRQKAQKRAKKKMHLTEIYEPAVLEKKMLTEKDDVIRMSDVPERMQLDWGIDVDHSAAPEEIEEESSWIFKNAFSGEQDFRVSPTDRPLARKGSKATSYVKQPEIQLFIANVLKLVRNEKKEVPFILRYRREEIGPQLNVDDLWRIYDYDMRWTTFKKTRTNLGQTLNLIDRLERAMSGALPVTGRNLESAPDNTENGEKETNGVTDTAKSLAMVSLKGEKYDNPEAADNKTLYEMVAQLDLAYIRPVHQSDYEFLEAATTDIELSDVQDFIQLHYGDVLTAYHNLRITLMQQKGEKAKGTKKASRRDLYPLFRKGGIIQFASRLGLSAEQFAINLEASSLIHKPPTEESSPDVMAEEHVSRHFPDSTEVLTAARLCYAMDLANHPKVRKYLRSNYSSIVRINAEPTQKGIKIIDEFHPVGGMKYLRGKPLDTFRGSEWLELEAAEKQGLMQVTFDADIKEFTRTVENFFLEEDFVENSASWNEERRQVINMVLNKYCFPHFEKQCRTALTRATTQYIAEECAQKLYRRVMMQPVPRLSKTHNRDDDYDDDDDEFDDSVGVNKAKVACIYLSNTTKESSFLVTIDRKGNLDITEKLQFIHAVGNPRLRKDPERQKELDELGEIMLRARPDRMLIPADMMEARDVMEDVRHTLDRVGLSHLQADFVNPDIGRTFGSSERAQLEFPDLPDDLRAAVSLCRAAQDPLLEIAGLANADDDILTLPLHHMHHRVSRPLLRTILHREVINATALVGVDINAACHLTHTQSVVPFVSGLGFRKAEALINNINQSQSRGLRTRTDIISIGKLGAIVFENCAAFLLVLAVKASAFERDAMFEDTKQEPLDLTRIHPESYSMARKIARDALEHEVEDKANPSAVIEEIRENPGALRALDLDAYAQQLISMGKGDKSITLRDIKEELIAPFGEKRASYMVLTEPEVFYLLTGESPKTLYEGCLVRVTVAFVDDHSAAVKLDNGLRGVISRTNVSDRDVRSVRDRLKRNQTIDARVLSIRFKEFEVDLTCRSSDLRNMPRSRGHLDRYYDEYKEADDQEALERTKTEANAPQHIVRQVVHDSFRNFNYAMASKYLEKMDIGDCVIRPARVDLHLTLTWKIAEGIYANVDIEESADRTAAKLGSRLRIGRESYDSLDELIGRYVMPVSSFMRDATDHPKFQDVDEEGAKRFCADQVAANPERFPYVLFLSRQRPGTLSLAYQPGQRNSCRMESVEVHPSGYRFRGKTHMILDDLIRWFKQNWNARPPPQAAAGAGGRPRDYGGSGSGGRGAPAAPLAPMAQTFGNAPPPQAYGSSSNERGGYGGAGYR